MKLIDITGQKFGRLTVIEKLPPRPSKAGGSLWLCLCECGNQCKRVGSELRRPNRTPSCGCFQAEWSARLGSDKEFLAKRSETIMTHGQKRRGAVTPEYKTWLRMKKRCYNPSDKDFDNWGGRGIRVCDRWLNDFSAFFADMGPRPSAHHSIDRIDSNRDYEPSNCRWATMQQQGGENRRGFVPVTVQGITFPTIADACRHFGVRQTTVNLRLKAGIPVEEAFTSGRLKARRTRESYLRRDLR
jgi:hypothetical protein